MAQQLWFLRHGEAVAHGTKPDAERELTARGRRQAHAAGLALGRLAVAPVCCYTSPLVRAADTAALVCGELELEPEARPELGKGFDVDGARALLLEHDADARVLVVGHEPSFSRVIFDLACGRVDVKKGGLVAVRVERGSGDLLVVLRPREIEAIAASP